MSGYDGGRSRRGAASRGLAWALAGTVALGALAAGGWYMAKKGYLSGLHAAPAHPNVLLIVWDTTRADRMSVYGSERETTPRIAAYAQDAVVYENAYAADMWTMPSHSSIFTGLPTTSHGVNTDYRWLDTHFTTLGELFSGAGYDTFAFTANQFASENCNLFQGMDVKLNVWTGRLGKQAKSLTMQKRVKRDASTEVSPSWVKPPGEVNMMWERGMAKDAGPLQGKTLVDWLKQRDDKSKPFFGFINMMEAHWPRMPSMDSRRQVLDQDLLEAGFTTEATLFKTLGYNLNKHDYTPAEIDAMVGVYDASLVDLDNATADLLDALDKAGVLDDTIVVITADHGEHLGDHHMFDHRYGLYDSLVHVPLIVRYPAKLTPTRIAAPVSTTGIFATLAQLTGIPLPADGYTHTDLTPQEPPGPVFSEYPLPDNRALARLAKSYGLSEADLAPLYRTLDSVVDGHEKLLQYSDGTTEYFDLDADPGELKNLSATSPDRVKALQERLSAWKSTLTPYDPALRTEQDHPKDLGAKEQQMLEMLGYLSPGGDDPGAPPPGEAPAPAPAPAPEGQP